MPALLTFIKKTLMLLSVFLCSWQLMANPAIKPSNQKMSPENCVGCHQSEVSDWKQSDHFKAMDIATQTSVLADFNNVEVNHFTQKAKFFRKGQEFWVTLSQGEKSQNHQLKYTFGHYPLQQFLVEQKNGHLQVLPFTWDSRPKAEGGQNWYPNYANEDIFPEDRLHWQQPMQNWNGMCADCHSDALKRDFNLADNSFNTTWDNINVGCQSCHGGLSKDHDKVQKTVRQSEILNQWVMGVGEKTARWHGEKRDNSFMDNCYACHSLRSPLTDGFKANVPFYDQFSPTFISPPLYYADGQIKEEVYVYGSFLQSKMFHKGVNCIDCHDKHTMKIKTRDNSLCLQCHSAPEFNTPKHHGHENNSVGSQCVECHMPETRYMGVDDRRDHSFKVPRPHLSQGSDIPNVCTNCHQDKNNTWAIDALADIHGKPTPLSDSEANYIKMQQGYSVPFDKLVALINDEEFNTLARATAIYQLPLITTALYDTTIQNWVNSPEPLIRIAVASIGNIVVGKERNKSFKKLINDKYKAVRVAAASHLLNTPNVDKALLAKAYNELIISNDINTWRGEGNLNQSLVHLSNGKVSKAIQALNDAINVDPYFASSYINLADIYRSQGNSKQEKATLDKGLTANPKEAMLHYAYGLYLIRNKQKEKAEPAFAKAFKLEPSNSRYAYLYILSKDSIGQTKQALSQLKMMMSRFKQDRRLAELGMSLSQKMQDQASYQYFNGFVK